MRGRSGGEAAWSVRAAVRLYAVLQRTLPADLVHAHGDEMLAAMHTRLAAAYRDGGAAGVWPVLFRAGADALSHAFITRLDNHPIRTSRVRRDTPGDGAAMLLSDVRLAARNLARRPGFTVVAALTLALGIGANVAVFAIVHSVLIRPLPFPAADRIVWIGHHAPGLDMADLANSTGTLAVYREHARSFAHIAAVRNSQRNFLGGSAPARIDVAVVSPALFDVLQVQPELGRRLQDADALPGAPRVAVLTHAGWTGHFGGARDVVGRTIELDGEVTEIVGVMPRGFAYPRTSTAALLPQIDATPIFNSFGLLVIARLAPGVELAGAQAELDALQPRHLEIYSMPDDFLENAAWRVSVRPLQKVTVGDIAAALWIVLGTVGFLLLVACASVANLFLIRAESRRREFGVRLALGATRGRIASALLSESLLIGVLGGVTGVALAWNAVRIIVASGPRQLPRLHEVQLGGTVLVAAALASVAAGLLLGLLSLIQQPRDTTFQVTRTGRGDIGGRDRQRLRRILIVAQLALALILLTGSGLMLRSFQKLRAVDPGIEPGNALVVAVSASGRTDAARHNARYVEMLDAARAIPGARVAGITTALPLSGGSMTASTYSIDAEGTNDDELPRVVWYEGVSDGYFAAAGTPLRAGREFSQEDLAHGRPVAVVNELFARTVFRGNALGERLRIGSDTVGYEIVGVAGDVRAFGLREDVRAMAYLPITATHYDRAIQNVQLVVRTDVEPLSLVQPMRAALRTVDPNAPILTARSLQSVLDASLADLTFTSTVLFAAALLALLLGAIGLYGVISYAVAERRSEIGVRVALGASPGAVQTLVLHEGVLLGGVGIGIGIVGALALTRLLNSVLFEISVHDPLTFLLVPGVLLAVTLLAAWLPARRAARIDPLEAMRGSG
jgi:putative ABC transport system permease protein